MGPGKSNFLDALRFVADSLAFSIQHALRDRGGVNEVRRRSGGHPTHFAIRVDFELDESSGNYGFLIGARPGEGYVVEREECLARERDENLRFFSTRRGRVVRSTIPSPPAASPDRLYLVNVSGLAAFRPVYDALSEMGFYNLRPDEMRALQPLDGGTLLQRDGGNIASVVAALASGRPELKGRIDSYLARMVPGIDSVHRRVVGPREALEFRRAVRGARHSWRFAPNNVSDGTLRALGALGGDVPGNGYAGTPTGRHRGAGSGAASFGRDRFGRRACGSGKTNQVLVTSHSVDMLNNPEIADTSIVAVRSEQGESRIGPLTTGAVRRCNGVFIPPASSCEWINSVPIQIHPT